MKKLMSISTPDWALHLSAFILRVSLAVLMIPHGYGKLEKFAELKEKFMDFMGLGPTVSLVLVIFSEFVCSGLLALGLFTRLTLIPLIITMGVALFKAHNGEIFGDGAQAALYLTGYTALLLLGPGKFSVDGIASK